MIRDHKDPIRQKIADLFYLQHQSTVDIALLLDMPQNTVLSHLRRFRLVVSSMILRWFESELGDFQNSKTRRDDCRICNRSGIDDPKGIPTVRKGSNLRQASLCRTAHFSG